MSTVLPGSDAVREGGDRAVPALRWWQGVGSPGVGGYLLADLVSAATLTALLLAISVVEGPTESLASRVGSAVLVLVVALVVSVPLAAVGIPLVHLCCLRVRSQVVHVLAAGVAGVLAAVVLGGGDLTGDPFALLLGLATASGRAAVVPLARARRRRREQA